jgi:hypothetical protein
LQVDSSHPFLPKFSPKSDDKNALPADFFRQAACNKTLGPRGGTDIMKALLRVSVAIVALAFMTGPAGASAIADLSADWSNVNNPNNVNPNGTWQYRQGTTDLPLVANWSAAGTAGFTQPAWAPSNNSGDFLPAEFQATSTAAAVFGADPNNPGHNNVLPGDVVMHTVDGFNGNPSLGVGNYLFTSAVAAGPVTISGMVWDAGLFYGTARPQDWALLVDGVEVDSGVLSGLISRSEAQTFDVNETLGIGDTVELELFEDPSAQAGFFVGAELTIATTAAVPAPLIGHGLVVMLAVGGVLFGGRLIERSKARRELGTAKSVAQSTSL